MSKHETLIETLEALSEDSREVDGKIALTLGWKKVGAGWAHWTNPEGKTNQYVPFFTGSLDDAFTLVPKGYITFKAMEFPANSDHPLKGKWLWNIAVFGSMKEAEGIAPTPILALCIAAMKARKPV